MPSQTTAIASSTGASSAEAQSRAVGLRGSVRRLEYWICGTYLDVSKALAVVALLRCRPVSNLTPVMRSSHSGPGLHARHCIGNIWIRAERLHDRPSQRTFGSAWVRTPVRLVAGLLAYTAVSARSRAAWGGPGLTVVAEPLRRRAHLCIASTSVACPSCKRSTWPAVARRRHWSSGPHLATDSPRQCPTAAQAAAKASGRAHQRSARRCRT